MKLRHLAAPMIAVAFTATLAACGSDDTATTDSVAVTDASSAHRRSEHSTQPTSSSPRG